jgi:hypothetical protein
MARRTLGTGKSFLVLFFKKEHKDKGFFLKKEAKTFICWVPRRGGSRS